MGPASDSRGAPTTAQPLLSTTGRVGTVELQFPDGVPATADERSSAGRQLEIAGFGHGNATGIDPFCDTNWLGLAYVCGG